MKNKQKIQNWMIVTAGGKGKRMGAPINKVFLPILGQPIIIHTLKILDNHPEIDKIVITIGLDDLKKLESLVKPLKFKKVVKLIPTSSERQQNTHKALSWIKKSGGRDTDLIGIHNAVNPLVLSDEISAVFEAALEHGGALLAYPAKDTTKICDEENFVTHTPIRKFVWSAQTPQVGKLKDLLRAFDLAEKEEFLGTDDTQLLEKIGIKIKMVPCSKDNFKLTFPEDLIIAEKILKERRNV
jgi:2-C-methyl-D-erythritol 4-phosphate cytidylyltransferase